MTQFPDEDYGCFPSGHAWNLHTHSRLHFPQAKYVYRAEDQDNAFPREVLPTSIVSDEPLSQNEVKVLRLIAWSTDDNASYAVVKPLDTWSHGKFHSA